MGAFVVRSCFEVNAATQKLTNFREIGTIPFSNFQLVPRLFIGCLQFIRAMLTALSTTRSQFVLFRVVFARRVRHLRSEANPLKYVKAYRGTQSDRTSPASP